MVRTSTHQAKLPMKATNLSRSAAPAQLSPEQDITITNRKILFCHLTLVSIFPLLLKSPFSMIRTAGNNWRGTDNKIAIA